MVRWLAYLPRRFRAWLIRQLFGLLHSQVMVCPVRTLSDIVRDRNILSTGYNGSIAGMPHCDDVGHMMENGHCVATIHAEANAILQAAKNGVMINGAHLYVSASPCSVFSTSPS